MPRPPTERGAPTTESASIQTAARKDYGSSTSSGDQGVESLAGLPEHLAAAYGAIWLTAERGLSSPSDGELLELTGFESYSSPNRILRQLRRRGLLAWRSFQRGRQVHVHALGKDTAEPSCKRVHWRHRDQQPTLRLADNDIAGPGDAA